MDNETQMMSFHSLLPDIAANETRVVTITDTRLGIKPGKYIFLELYCTDKSCDCRRAMIQVMDESGNLYATLSYGWEDFQFYLDWMYGDRLAAEEIPGISLYSFQQQSKYASKFLDLFRDMMKDKALAERYQRHYAQFKAALHDPKVRMKPELQSRESVGAVYAGRRKRPRGPKRTELRASRSSFPRRPLGSLA